MRKIIMCITLIFAVASFGACGETESTKGLTNDNPAVTEAVTDKEITTTTPSKDDFQQLPEEALDSFNFVIDFTKKEFPIEDDTERQYGYQGTEMICNESCYVFSVYNFVDDSHEKVGTFAKCLNSNNVFMLNEETGAYEIMKPDESSVTDDTIITSKTTTTATKATTSAMPQSIVNAGNSISE